MALVIKWQHRDDMEVKQEYYPPFFYVEMPLDKNRNGPEMNPKKVVYTTYEIWDSANQTVGIFYDKDTLLICLDALNGKKRRKR